MNEHIRRMRIRNDKSVVQRSYTLLHCCASKITAISPHVPVDSPFPSFSSLLFRFSPLESTSSSLFVSGSRSCRCLAISPMRFCIQSRENRERSWLVNGFHMRGFNFLKSPFVRQRIAIATSRLARWSNFIYNPVGMSVFSGNRFYAREDE